MEEKHISVLNLENILNEMINNLDDIEDKVITTNIQKTEDYCGKIERELKHISTTLNQIEKTLNIKKTSKIIFFRNKPHFIGKKRFYHYSS